jgi:hypothetical protein
MLDEVIAWIDEAVKNMHGRVEFDHLVLNLSLTFG